MIFGSPPGFTSTLIPCQSKLSSAPCAGRFAAGAAGTGSAFGFGGCASAGASMILIPSPAQARY